MNPNSNVRVVFDYTSHRNMWLELSRTGTGNKQNTKAVQDYIRRVGQPPVYGCFACQAVADLYGRLVCLRCPLQWPNNFTCAASPALARFSLYAKWHDATYAGGEYREEARQLAKRIAELPLSPDWPGEII